MTTRAAVEAKRQVVKAALSVADEVAKGIITPAELDAAAAAECRALFRVVAGPGDLLWELQGEVCRDVLAMGGVPADELAEWAAVQATAEGLDGVRQPSFIERMLAAGADDEAEEESDE